MERSPTTKRLFGAVIGGFVAVGALGISHAGTNTFSFNSPASTNSCIIFEYLNGGGYWRSSDGSPNDPEAVDPSTNGYFALTDALYDQTGSIVFPDFDCGCVVKGFKLACDVRVGAGTYPPADGFSISFARPDDPTVVNHGAVGEGGTLTGLAVCFDTFDNGGIHVVGLNLRVDGTLVTNIPLPFVSLPPSDPNFAASIQTGAADAGLLGLTWQPLSVEYTTNGLLNVEYKGVTLLTNFAVPFSPTPGRFVVGGRTGALWEYQHIDNLRIVTLPVGPALQIAGFGRSVLIWWPTNAPCFTLESSASIGTNQNWRAFTDSILVVGDQNVTVAEATAGSKFFRLRGR